MSDPAQQLEKKYTYADYLTWPSDRRWELINGIVYSMAPAPSKTHQEISRELITLFNVYLKNKPCQLFHAPFDVRLSENTENEIDIHTVVQPDLLVVCDEEKLDEKGCKGAPDLIIEILSPATAVRDMKEKLYLYEQHGVKEYWIVHPMNRLVEIFRTGETGEYKRPEVYANKEVIKVGLFPDLDISLEDIFQT